MSEAKASASTTNDEQNEKEQLAVNRQEFLNLAWLASLGFMVLEVSGVSILFAYPRFKEGEFGGIFTFGKVTDLPEIETTPVNFPKVKMWITNTDEGLMALYKVCPHLGCLYGWSDQEFKFICPCHGSQYEHDGDYISGPTPRALDYFTIRIVDEATGEVLSETSADGGPVPVPDNPNAIIQIDTGAKVLGEVHD